MLALLRRRAIRSGSLIRAAHTAATPDVIVVGAGHNGLIAATLLARQGLRVSVLEERASVGGACITDNPFPRAPGLAQNSGAYLLGVMPPEIVNALGLNDHLRLLRRDPHYFLPTEGEGGGHLLFGSDSASTKLQFLKFFSLQDWEAYQDLQAELAALRDDVAPYWLSPPLPTDAAADRFVRPELRDVFLTICRGSVREFLDRFGFRSDLLKTMVAVTDGFAGAAGGWDTPGGAHNLLAHNMCRLPGSDGTWMVVQGGMGRVTQALATAATSAGADIQTDTAVEGIEVESGVATGVWLRDKLIRARAVVVNADPFALGRLVGPEALPSEVSAMLERLWRPGMTMKVNLALRNLPKYTSLPENQGQHRTTTHLLPGSGDGESAVNASAAAYEAAAAGLLPEFPTMEVYTQTAVDPGLRDAEGRHSAALFVQWVPHQPVGSSWEAEKATYVDHLLGLWERFAPGVAGLVDDVAALAPPDIEARFGISGGHIHHVDNSFSGTDRFPHRVPGVAGLYSASAGTHPAGSVVGAAGWLAAAEVAKDLEVAGRGVTRRV